MMVKGKLHKEAEALRYMYGIDIRRLPCRALRLLAQNSMTIGQLVYVADEIAKLRREERHMEKPQ